MKYIVILGDGMADYPLPELGGKTPLAAAKKPCMDELAAQGMMGMVKTVPDGMPAGSDTANLSVLGYDPQKYYSGRSPFEAVSMGIALTAKDLTFRCNFVTLSEADDYTARVMLDHSAGEITSGEAHELLAAIKDRLGSKELAFYPGVSYRHLLVWTKGPADWELTPPHDILGRAIGPYLPAGPHAAPILAMMKESTALLADHPVNRRRRQRGLNPANAIWIWGEGRKPALLPFREKYGLRGGVISAVDLIKGIGLCAGLEVIPVAGATGDLDTNFEGKAQAALTALKQGMDFVYIHLEAPDECGHRQELDNKITAIEYIDRRVLRPVIEGLEAAAAPYRLLLLPDHATPLSLRTHTADPVPFLLYDSTRKAHRDGTTFTEAQASATGLFVAEGHRLMDIFL
ncbi:MAG TPA: cofactor-independent phosphoglycerate mutase, partial [Firmicutes bacterium]|nr:cofactor-independent phosphoglycerate mutase [Bacillota bacterium]